MSKTISQIRDEIATFYRSTQQEVTDTSTGSVAGGLIYATAAGIKQVYDQLDEIERQAYIATANGRYLDLLIEGGFFLPRQGATRSTGYVLIYGDEQIFNTEVTGSSLVCADYDYETGQFISGLNSSIKFSGENNFGSSSVVYSLVKPRNTNYFKRDRLNRYVIDLKGKQARYLILPVASVLSGSQVNLSEGALSSFINPPQNLQYVANVSNIADYILSFGDISTSPIYSRNTSMISYNKGTRVFSVVNAFNFSRSGFIDISYRAKFPTRLIRASYKSISGDSVSGGLSFEYTDKTQTSLALKDAKSYVTRFIDNNLITYNLEKFSYFDSELSETVTYTVDSSDVWRATSPVTLQSPGDTILLADGVTEIGPSTGVGPLNNLSGSTNFFQAFFGNNDWVIQQKRDQISQDVIFDPDNVLSETFQIKEEYRLSTAQDSMDDRQYRNYFKNYINSLPRSTANSLEFAAQEINGIEFSRVLPAEESPVGTTVLLAASSNGFLSEGQRQNVYNYLKDDWVGAGVNLVVRPPDIIGIKVSISVTLTDESLENSVKRNIESSISNYLTSKEPGQEVKYGDIYRIVSQVYGVKNVSKLIVGRNNPIHYGNYPENYARVALNRIVSFNDEYEFYEDSVFEESRNDVVFSSDRQSLNYNTLEDTLRAEELFSSANEVLYGAVQGVFASDANIEIVAGSDQNVMLNGSLFPVSSDAFSLIEVTLSSDNASIFANYNGQVFEASDISSTKKLFSIPIVESSTDFAVSFSSSDYAGIETLQAFIHAESIDSYLIMPYLDLKTFNFIDSSKLRYVYDVDATSNRYKNLKLIGTTDENERARLEAVLDSLISAACTSSTASSLGVCSLSIFQNIIRDYQYGTNFSGKNSQGYKDLFVEVSDTNDEPFRHFLNYLTTAPLSNELDSFYPLTPSEAKNKEISDYELKSKEVARIFQNIFNPSLGLSSSITFEVS